jgi:hypothetical protein
MSLNLNRRVKVFFTILTIIFITGCGSDNPTVRDDPNPKPDETTNFEGTYTIYEELKGLGYDTYDVTIKQNGDDAQLISGDQSLACTIHEDELSCQGTITSDNGNRFNYTNYTLFLNDDKSLTGSAEWTYYTENDNFSGRSDLTTIQPEVGSLIVLNDTNITLRTYNFTACSSNPSNPQLLDPPIEPHTFIYVADIDPGCYYLTFCTDENASQCSGNMEVNIKRAETFRLKITE